MRLFYILTCFFCLSWSVQGQTLREKYSVDTGNTEVLSYFSTGEVHEAIVSVIGSEISVKKTFYINGDLQEITEQIGGVDHGKVEFYSENGLLVGEGNYVQGKLEGKLNYFDKKGNISMIIMYNNGLKNGVTTIYKNNKVISELSFVDNLLDGEVKLYGEDGKVISISIYKQGKQIDHSMYNDDTIFYRK